MLLFGILFLYSLTGAAEVKKTKTKDYCSAKCNKTKLICGNDGKDYESPCHLKRSNCLSKLNITIVHQGKCDACPLVCRKVYKPICATNQDGEKTFLNICHFKNEMCQVKDPKKKMEVKKKGPCKKWHRSNCPEGCADIWAPVCASNGKSYSSICAVKMDGCSIETDGKALKLKKIGYCKKGACPESCPENYKPTCGNDGTLYANECELRLKACKTGKLKELKRAQKKKCRKLCVKECPPYDNKVCGSDNITYQNECLLQQINCLNKKKLKVMKKEPCETVKPSRVELEAELIKQVIPGVSAPTM